jgi:hypothetical protein
MILYYINDTKHPKQKLALEKASNGTISLDTETDSEANHMTAEAHWTGSANEPKKPRFIENLATPHLHAPHTTHMPENTSQQIHSMIDYQPEHPDTIN